MSSRRTDSLGVKLYILVLFFCGIALWLCGRPIKNPSCLFNIYIDEKIIDTLSEKGITQGDILNQYVRERKTATAKWNEFYKVVKLKPKQDVHLFQDKFRQIARSMKMGLSKLDSIDGSVTYRFDLPDRTYYNIKIVPVKSLKNGYKR